MRTRIDGHKLLPWGQNRTQLTTPVCWLRVARYSTLGSGCSFDWRDFEEADDGGFGFESAGASDDAGIGSLRGAIAGGGLGVTSHN